MKVVINKCYGGFSLSPEATLKLWRRGGPVDATPIDDCFGVSRGKSPDGSLGKNETLKRWREYLAAPADSRPARPVVFVTRSSAEAYAIRRVQCLSRDGLAHPLEFVPGAFLHRAGGPCFAVEPAPGPLGEWLVLELTAADIGRRQQSGMRHAVDALYAEAESWTEQALASRLGAVRAHFFTEARQARERARDIETRLTMSVVRTPEPFLLAEVAS